MASDGLDYWINVEKICHLNPFFVLSQNVSSFSFLFLLSLFLMRFTRNWLCLLFIERKSFSKGMNINNIILAYHKCSCIDIFYLYSVEESPFTLLGWLITTQARGDHNINWKLWPFACQGWLISGPDNTTSLSQAHQTPNDGALSFAFQFHRKAFKAHTWTAFELYWQ